MITDDTKPDKEAKIAAREATAIRAEMEKKDKVYSEECTTFEQRVKKS